MFAGVVSAFVPQRLLGVMSNEGAGPLEKLRAAAEAGVLVPKIEREYPLAEAPDALRALEARTHPRQGRGARREVARPRRLNRLRHRRATLRQLAEK